ncbi:tRNA1(Val) (adenine(37)-N6)-methyltransferase [Ferruginibacter albus]|uniref:tRNA1(Val) (adenine(37)-N6)-methyltransferase n=1 Tax=Ferruginibacter albus TaxID=2875540 RepID=UPI001CC4B003|nr:methyltransferase [Ferruginibacter albus]UAY53106.1 methyltransferase [Ferruginibacter albus]
MPNSYFQFKQFIINQDKCAMKVTTDGCLFGATCAEVMQSSQLLNTALDIGAGTGLLSLMVAQKNPTKIDAIEIDESAYSQAKENIENSLWKEQITIFHADIIKFSTDKKYDCIFTNPPFYQDDLRSIHLNKNKAKHDESLTLIELLNCIDKRLNKNGIFLVLLPYHRSNYFETEAAKLKFFLTKKIAVKQTPKHTYFRTILIFSRKENATLNQEIIIKDENGNYTKEFYELLKDYYL